MSNTVYTLSYDEPPLDRGEILRYAGVRGDAPELCGLLEECISEARGRLVYKVCYAKFPITKEGELLNIGFTSTSSSDLSKNLRDCDSIVLFAATVGLEIDRLITRYSSISPTKALIFQALGAERIESLCNSFCRDIKTKKKAEGRSVRPRFSAGYGDFPIEEQRNIFAALDCPKRIGVSLNESLLMSPSKSVTAIIGIDPTTNDPQN